MSKGKGTLKCIDCGGSKKTKESLYCYTCQTQHRPSGLVYDIKVINRGWIKPGEKRNLGIKRSDEYKQKMSLLSKGKRRSIKSEFKKGENKGSSNHKWKGDDVGYFALHRWVKSNYKWDEKCELCGSPDSLNIASKDWSYRRDKEAWWVLCFRCHRQYDKQNWGLASKLFNL